MATRKTRFVLIVGGIAAAALVGLAGFRTGGPEQQQDIQFIQNGRASWYGPGFHGQKTASGIKFNQEAPTAAHKTLPLGSEVTVTNLDTGRSVNVEINDRGPYVTGRNLDLSKAAARQLDIIGNGTARVRIEATGKQLDPDGDGRPGARSDNQTAAPGAK